jgi:hypothetical protein
MSLKKFGDKDIFVNTMRTFPTCDFTIVDSNVIYNSIPHQSGARNDTVRNVSSSKGFISLYEYNIDRPYVNTGRYVQTGSFEGQLNINSKIEDTGRIYPWISKDSARSSFRTANSFVPASASTYNNEFQYGDVLTDTYPFSASITREYITTPYASNTSYNASYVALRNTLNYYKIRSSHYMVNSEFGNKDTQTLNMISVPSIFYGTRMYPGSMSLKWYFTGSLIGELQDTKKNGELIQVGPPGSPDIGKVAGVALYDEGVVLLTGSWNLGGSAITLNPGGPAANPSWIYYGAGANDGCNQTSCAANFVSASFQMSFKGQTETQVMTMMAHAKRGEVNYSNNPTFLKYGQTKTFFTSSHIYEEKKDLLLKTFERQVFVSRVAIYDRNKNLIGIATLGKPILKKEAEDISFKLKLDI